MASNRRGADAGSRARASFFDDLEINPLNPALIGESATVVTSQIGSPDRTFLLGRAQDSSKWRRSH
jgi:hypothetical protein